MLKKFISAWLMPLPFSVLLLVAGCIFLWCKREKLGRGLVTLGLAVLVICSCTAVSDLALLRLEERYPKWNGRPNQAEFVVVMGAAQSDAPRLPLTNRPNTAAIYRLMEGIAIYRANPGSKLIISGGPETTLVLTKVAVSMGIAEHDLNLQAGSFDTEEEVGLLKPMVQGHRFVVVTSAAHMPRTMTLFHAAGLDPIPAPTHFLDRNNPHPNWRDFMLPDTESLERTEFALHEYLGLLWLQVKSWFG
ncbi:MAG: ElyC/SanA/YdcF family protein [Spongiibacteraceae bacterium]